MVGGDQLTGLLNFECGLPFVGSLMIMGTMASAGIPGLMGFVAEFLIFRGSFAVFPTATLACRHWLDSGLFFDLAKQGIFWTDSGGFATCAVAGTSTSLDFELDRGFAGCATQLAVLSAYREHQLLG